MHVAVSAQVTVYAILPGRGYEQSVAILGAEYARTLARVLHRPALVPVPSIAPRAVLGSEGSAELAEASHNVQLSALLAVGHSFRRSDLESSLRHQLGRNRQP